MKSENSASRNHGVETHAPTGAIRKLKKHAVLHPTFIIRNWQDLVRLLFTGLALAIAFSIAFAVRFDWTLDAEQMQHLLASLPLVVVVQTVILACSGVHLASLRGVSFQDLGRLVWATSLGSAVTWCVAVNAGVFVPRSVWLVDWVFAIILLGGIRAVAREAIEQWHKHLATEKSRTLVVGTCPTSEAIVRTLRATSQSRCEIIGMVARTEDSHLVGHYAGPVRVLGSVDDLQSLIVSHSIDEVLLVSGSLGGKQIRAIEQICNEAIVAVRVIPVLDTLIDGNVAIQPRALAIEDLLKRESVQIDLNAISCFIGGSTIVVTGAAGSIGSEICRQLVALNATRLVILDRNESGLFWLERELRRLGSDATVIPCIGDITDSRRMDAILAEYRPHILFHAAAYKHVPLMEDHPGEAIKNISLASARLAELASEYGVKTFVMVSTDKAVNPTSVMGTCKRFAEMFVQAIDASSTTMFLTVRFGNVLDSAGSVVPVFREQILRGGPITVTHPEIERFFMTIPEASRLVIQAAAMGHGGEVFVLDMGEPVKIVELAQDMIRLSGLEQGRDIEIDFTGLRPGEKLFEELFTANERLFDTAHSKIQSAETVAVDLDHLRWSLDQLELAAHDTPDAIRSLLRHLLKDCQASQEVKALSVSASAAGPKVPELAATEVDQLPRLRLFTPALTDTTGDPPRSETFVRISSERPQVA